MVGLDLSAAMLVHARENVKAQGTRDFIAEGYRVVCFAGGNAANQPMEDTFGLVTSTFDALNHLPDIDALRGRFRSTAKVLAPGGLFVFDLNSGTACSSGRDERAGRGRPRPDHARGGRRGRPSTAPTPRSRLPRGQENGLYKRFNQVAYNSIFAMDEVASARSPTPASPAPTSPKPTRSMCP